MDEFGVFTERYGLKPQGKSAPMSGLRDQTIMKSSTVSSSGSIFDAASRSSSFDNFGGGVDLLSSSSVDYFDSVLSARPASSADRGILSGSSTTVSNDDFFGSFVSKPSNEFASTATIDLLDDFPTHSTLKVPPSSMAESSNGFMDDLLPGFTSSGSTTDKSASGSFSDPFGPSKSTTSKPKGDSPLNDFNFFDHATDSQNVHKNTRGVSLLRPPPKPGQVLMTDSVKSSLLSSMDELDDFAMGVPRHSADKECRGRKPVKSGKFNEAEDASKNAKQDIPANLFSSTGSPRSASAPKSRATTSDFLFDFDISNDSKAEPQHKRHSESLLDSELATANLGDDLGLMLGGAYFSGNVEDIHGESEERRKARLGREQRAKDRVAQAVADMNERDRKSHNEKEERRKIAEQMDVVIKCWARGKEGNIRALLSSLHQVLWPECGWEAVSMADIVTSASVKKVYRKATLCVHPDKVQQKGSTLIEMYISEKVFDYLKEAWNKFNRDER